jgi:DNA modification methylase
MHKSEQGSGSAHGTYEDTPEIYWSLVDTLLAHLDNFCEESAHLLFWFSMDYYTETLEKLSTRFSVNPFPLIWHKSDGSGILPDPNRGPRRTYETALFASRGDRKIVRAVSNSVASPIQRGRHMSEKPQAVLGHFFRMLVDSHSAVLDPTCGSGSAIRAAVTAGAGRYLGIELNKEFADHADEVLQAHLDNPQVDLETLVQEAEDNV